jgi:hypothetical protein
MDLVLTRVYVGPEGAFGTLSPMGKPPFAVTLEHSYANTADSWYTKVPRGTYVCKRGRHTLSSGKTIDTFEVTGVSDHTGILFHPLNVQEQSEGCVGIGLQYGPVNGEPGILQSLLAFTMLMARQSNVDTFNLTVE